MGPKQTSSIWDPHISILRFLENVTCENTSDANITGKTGCSERKRLRAGQPPCVYLEMCVCVYVCKPTSIVPRVCLEKTLKSKTDSAWHDTKKSLTSTPHGFPSHVRPFLSIPSSFRHHSTCFCTLLSSPDFTYAFLSQCSGGGSCWLLGSAHKNRCPWSLISSRLVP